ncbi:tyrosine-type recombinase/integrase [Reyranella sp.]|uniref:tyrosine-type recombinase/integrase n=1 Tax=Reyranella sp. TaxID=1929291 RepID=UPI004037202C
MTVFQNRQRNGEWRYDFRLNGVRHHGPCVDPVTGRPARSEKEAREHEALARGRARAGQTASRSISRPGSFTFGQAVALHIKSQVGSSAQHVANLKLYGRELLVFFGADTPVAGIGQERVDAYRVHASEAPVQVWRGGPRKRDKAPGKAGKIERKRSPASVNHRLNCLRAAFTQAHRIKDPVSGQPMLPFPPEVKPVPAPKRRPAPMPDAELFARLAKAPPWVIDALDLARYFGLRRAEALSVTLAHIDREERALRFSGSTTKSRRDEFARPVPGGWEVLNRLARQARARGVQHLVTWPGRAHWRAWLDGKKPKDVEWVPLASIRRSWGTTAKAAGVARGHRVHDVRARYITEVAKVASSATTQEAARHQDPATTARYTAIAGAEVARALEAVPRPKKRA